MTRKRIAIALLSASALACGCSAGYPDTDERIENIDDTIKAGNLSARPNDDRDKRFDTQVQKNETVKRQPAPEVHK